MIHHDTVGFTSVSPPPPPSTTNRAPSIEVTIRQIKQPLVIGHCHNLDKYIIVSKVGAVQVVCLVVARS